MEKGISIVMTDYEKICDFNNLYKAHCKARRTKRAKPEVLQFELKLSENLIRISRDLKAGTYKMQGYYHFKIYEPKERDVYASSYQDRVILHCVCDEVLMPLIQKRIIYDNVACQTGKGTSFAIKRLTYFYAQYYKKYKNEGYILKCDISKYFASIDHQALKEMIRKIVKDENVFNLLEMYIDSYETKGRHQCGLPLGNQSSQCFAIYYLNPLDRLIKEQLKIKYYIRYMDDFLLIHPDKGYLQECLIKIEQLVEGDLKLKLNEKTRIYHLKEGIEFLGWKFYLSKSGKVIRKMKPQSKKRFKRRLKKLQQEYEEGTVSLEDVRNSIASYKGHLRDGHTFRLRQEIFSQFNLTRK